MPKLSEYTVKPWPNILTTGDSGAGKSTFLAHGPTPSVWLLVDKDTPTIVDGVDMGEVYFKQYPPADVDLTKSDYLPPRNVADDLISDLNAIKNHFVSILRGKPTPLKIRLMDGTIEEWPTPAMVVLEGAAPASHQSANRILNMSNKHAVEDFGNKLRFYDTRLQFLTNFYDVLLRLPCVVGVSTWSETDKVSQKTAEGKVELVDTGIVQPRFGGQLNDLLPGKFDSSFFFFVKNGFYYARTQDDDKHRGFKIGNHVGVPAVVPMTIQKDKTGKLVNPCKDLWNLLLKR